MLEMESSFDAAYMRSLTERPLIAQGPGCPLIKQKLELLCNIMPKLTIEPRISIVKSFYQNGSSVLATRRKFVNVYGTRNGVATSSISDLITKFGTVHDIRKGNVGPPKTVTTEETVAKVQDLISNNPTTSSRRGAQEVGMKREFFRKILKTRLMMFPYKTHFVQPLSTSNFYDRWCFANTIIEMIDNKSIY